MFTTVISSLTSLLPKYFIFGAYVPVLIFGAINVGLAYFFSIAVRESVQYLFPTYATLTVSIIFVATVVAAYLLTVLSNFLREVLEGRHVLQGRIADDFRKFEEVHFNEVRDRYLEARTNRFRLSESIARCFEMLRLAANVGTTKHPGAKGYDANDPAAIALSNLYRQSAAAIPSLETLLQASNAMANALRRYDRRADDFLADHQREMLIIMSRVASRTRELEYDRATRLQTYPLTGGLRPTRMGNIAASLQSYCVDRFGMDLAYFMSRLQAIPSMKDDRGYSNVLDVKTQLDFLAACCGLTFLTTALWFTALAFWGASWLTFVLVAILGPASFVIFYLLGVQSYLTYAQALRAFIDLNRFALLRALHVPLPNSLRQERIVWSTLSRASLSGPEGVDYSYEHTAVP